MAGSFRPKKLKVKHTFDPTKKAINDALRKVAKKMLREVEVKPNEDLVEHVFPMLEIEIVENRPQSHEIKAKVADADPFIDLVIRAHCRAGNYETAQKYLPDVNLENASSLARFRYFLGLFNFKRGQLELAVSDLDLSREAYEKMSERKRDEGFFCFSRGYLLMALTFMKWNEYSRDFVKDYLYQAFSNFHNRGYKSYEAEALTFGMVIEYMSGNREMAGEINAQAIDIFERIGDLNGQAWHFYYSATLLAMEDDFKGAKFELADSKGKAIMVGNNKLVAACTRLEAQFTLHEGDVHNGVALMQQARDLFIEAKDEYGAAQCENSLVGIGRKLAENDVYLGFEEDGTSVFEEYGYLAFRRMEKLGDSRGMAKALYEIGQFQVLSGKTLEARRNYESALGIVSGLEAFIESDIRAALSGLPV
jgi:hypothetical protein